MIEHLETIGTRAFYRPRGKMWAGPLVDQITLALKAARQLGASEVLIDVCLVSGFDSPGPAFRRWAVKRWATASAHQLRVAMVAPYELICPEKTGLLVAAEKGLCAHICVSEAEALQWLDDVPGGAPPDAVQTTRVKTRAEGRGGGTAR